jgi:hypothetical protein
MLKLQVLNDSTYREYTNLVVVEIKPVDFLLLPEYKRRTSYFYKSSKLKIIKTLDGKLLLQVHSSEMFKTSLPFTYKSGEYYTLEINLLKKFSAKIIEKFHSIPLLCKSLEFLQFENLKSFTQVYTRSFEKDLFKSSHSTVDLQKLNDQELFSILEEISEISFNPLTLSSNTFQETVLEDMKDVIFIRVKEMSLSENEYMILRNSASQVKFGITRAKRELK